MLQTALPVPLRPWVRQAKAHQRVRAVR